MATMLVCDVDGTIAQKGTIVPELIKLFLVLQQMGVTVTLSTGRPLIRMSHILEQWTPFVPLIVEGGGRIVSAFGQVEQQHILHEDVYAEFVGRLTIEKDSVELVAASAGNMDGRYIVYTREGQKIPAALDGLIEQHCQTLPEFLCEGWNAGIVKVSIQASKPLVFEGLSANVTSNEGYIDVTSYGVNKGSALLELVKLCGDDYVVACGNDHNDLSMFLPEVGTRVSVGEDCPALIEMATHTATSPEDLVSVLRNIFDM